MESAFVLHKDEVGERVKRIFRDFLMNFKLNDKKKYFYEWQTLTRPERNTLSVSYEHMESFSRQLAETVRDEFYRIYPYLCSSANDLLRENYTVPNNKDVYISITDFPTANKVRELTTNKIGSLMRISGQVIRTHPVHPELASGTFRCLDCQSVISNVEQQFKFTSPAICKNNMCLNRSRFFLDIDQSKFIDFQKVRIQETQAELPRGSIPRSLDVILRAETVEKAQAGDKCDFIGTLIVVPDVANISLPGARAQTSQRSANNDSNITGVRGLKSLGVRDLSYRLIFLACNVIPTSSKIGARDYASENMTPEELKKLLTDQEWQKIYSMSKDYNIYNNIVHSMFPTIHGHDEVKRGILLMMLGGVPKTTKEGTSLRGDVNICIVGDPSTAKSQFLKQVEQFSLRAIYTSGKASTAAGLTAAVVQDEESHEFVIEAGALMLADNGICCIDEFDKMDIRDQVSIHEVMEQQTISITKAGIKALLNARTSVLAAANPINGRYDRSKSLKHNIHLSAPIMSRFDLFFILVDEPNEINDFAIARCIVDLHRKIKDSVYCQYSMEDIQRYILFARLFKPKITKESQKYFIEQYKALRQKDGNSNNRSSWRITVRQLESLVRMSEALAKLHCDEYVLPKHVKEACRLINKSIVRIECPDVILNDERDYDLTTEKIEVVSREVADSSKANLRLTFEEYRALTNMLVTHIRMKEEKQLPSDSLEKSSITRNQLVDWYLSEIEHEISTESQLEEQTFIINKVIDNLIQKDHILIEIHESSSMDSESIPNKTQDNYLFVHPNYVIE